MLFSQYTCDKELSSLKKKVYFRSLIKQTFWKIRTNLIIGRKIHLTLTFNGRQSHVIRIVFNLQNWCSLQNPTTTLLKQVFGCEDNNKKPNVIPQVTFEEDRVYADLTPTL